jgi:NAD(P)-dependent dehydrogenase (short-subunit alcohol dehydrogenase family)
MKGRDWWMLAGLGAAAWAAHHVQRSLNGYDFRNRTVLITGARGLGLVLARQLAERGAHVAVCARDPEELRRADEDLAGRGPVAAALPCDLRDRDQVRDLFRQVRERLGPIDVLINNAGVIEVGPAETMTLEDYEDAMATNFWAPLYAILEALPEMRQRRQGRIVNIASVGGKVSVLHLLPYCASKFALVGLSEGLRAELARDGVVVTTVCPGLMRTGSPRNATFKGRHREEYAFFAISDSLPGATISAESAARQILEACRCGDAEVVLSLPARAATLLHDLFPGLTADVFGLVNRFLLPEPGGIGTGHALGSQSESAAAPSLLTALTERAARENNEMGSRQPAAGTALPGSSDR